MKKILITHVQNTLNYGSAMMALNLIIGLRRYLKQEEVEIYCECDEYHLERLKRGTGEENLKRYMLPKENISSKIDTIKKYFLGHSNVIDTISEEFDTMIVLGGDDLSETYLRGAVLKGIFYYHVNKKCQVILAGQSLGPFHGIYLRIASIIFRDLIVATRDDNSFNFTLNHLKVKEIFQSRDLALLDLPRQKEFSKSDFVKQITINQKYLVVVPSGLVHRYTENRQGYIETWSEIIQQLHKMYPDFIIFMLSHVLFPPHSNDSVIIDEVYERLENKSFIKRITLELQPAEARAILGGARFVITGRMHAAVSTYFMKKPAIALAYSEKYDGVIAKGLQLPQLLVECRNQNWDKESIIIQQLFEKIAYVEENYNELTQTIDTNVKACSTMIKGQIEYISQKILHR